MLSLMLMPMKLYTTAFLFITGFIFFLRVLQHLFRRFLIIYFITSFHNIAEMLLMDVDADGNR